ncbi:MAG: hypothetical protein NTW74_15430 [Acidobacteria bacterium]|nr:hypothetical protein [Acidobacteriota bacterium]
MSPETSRRDLLFAMAQVVPYVPRQSDRPEAIDTDEAGFESIFDGKTLDGWQGDPRYWRVADGLMTGEITPETIIKSNTFIIQLSQRCDSRQGDPGESVCDARIPVRHRWAESLYRQ